MLLFQSFFDRERRAGCLVGGVVDLVAVAAAGFGSLSVVAIAVSLSGFEFYWLAKSAFAVGDPTT